MDLDSKADVHLRKFGEYKDAALHNTQNTCKVILMANDAPDYTFYDKGMISPRNRRRRR